jgi:N-acetyl-gamma-glutamyl-phosphate reductase
MADDPRPSVGIIGASGYTGSELVRLLCAHPGVSLDFITSESHRGRLLSDVHPHLKGIFDLELSSAEDLGHHEPNLVFLALPHGVSMEFVKGYGCNGFKIIDLSGDFRLRSGDQYGRWYGKRHLCPEMLGDATYGLPEVYRGEIVNSRLVANPGCYPTSVVLALAPLLSGEIIEMDCIIVDSKSGVTGAGAKTRPVTHFPSANEDFKAYSLTDHRHTPEMEQALGEIADREIDIQFTPHLTPLSRGIQTSVYCRAADGITQKDLEEAYDALYGGERFIRVRDRPPSVRDVRGSNFCDVHVRLDERTGNVIALSAIDNLVKGASGQAIQNMNIMLGFDEATGLGAPPLSP